MTKNIKVSAIVSCYNGAKYLPDFLENCAQQTIRDQTEIVLAHNDPSEKELSIVREFEGKYPNLIKHLAVSKEPLAVSMNRCIKNASGEYVCIWNIDDLRTANSLELMVQVLDNNPACSFTYGDFIIIKEWKSQTGKYIRTPEWDNHKRFVEGFPEGPFPMWRKYIHENLGYFDEQLKQGADYEFFARFSINHKGRKTKGLLGYYLDEGLGLSTKKATLQPVERTFIELRYGIYHKLDFWYYFRAKKYNLTQVLEDSKWKDLSVLEPNFIKYRENIFWLIYAIARYPFWILWRIFNKLRKIS